MNGYSLLDFGGLARLERWGAHRLVRPDPRADTRTDPGSGAGATGLRRLPDAAWADADARYEGRIGGGRWEAARPLPDRWQVEHDGLRFLVGCSPSGHTGLFPEQAAHWQWMREALAGHTPSDAPPEVLNLFAYTGGASVALAAAGARVTHVDASRPAIGWARENAVANGVDTIRWIHEDARRFVDRARRRGRRYDGLLLDPPVFGRGPAGDWRLDRDLADLLEAAAGLLSAEPVFALVNVYSGDVGVPDLERLLAWATEVDPAGQPGLELEADVLSLAAEDGRRLPTGIYARWRRHDSTSTRRGARG